MSAPTSPFYNNAVNAEYFSVLKKQSFDAQQKAFHEAHPPVAIYRFASDGSQTRNGGVIQESTSLMTVEIESGQKLRLAKIGDYAVYIDGSKARIITGGGSQYGHLALVGSRLSNGDEIINTRQSGIWILERENIPNASDFLPISEG